MTITPTNYRAQRATSSDNDSSPRSRPAQMDELDSLRGKLFTEDSVLASFVTEPINLEDNHYALLRSEMESDAQDLEAESWSLAVDQNYLKSLNKEAVKRQDVIYELIQTEMHHVRTIKILLYVYMHELRESLQMEDAKLERLFPGLDVLLHLHQHFLICLKVRRTQSLEAGCPNNYQITQLGDILISQFSGDLGEKMKECYSVFCGHQTDAVGFYKEQLQNSKKLQGHMRKIGQLPLVRRLGIPECFLLVTQRITKYPVLVERIIQNTQADTEEYDSLVEALALIRNTISEVNTQVSEYEKAARLREISQRLEPKSRGRLKDGRVFRREDLIQGTRTLLQEATFVWKAASGRSKDIHAVLLSDVLLLLQEKDQKLVFAAVDNKPPVISLQKLIVREVANVDKAMFLICASSSMPEMYEIHTSSREERNTWMALIREAVETCPKGEKELYSEQEASAKLQEFQDGLKMKDDQIVQSLTDKLQMFAAFSETVTGNESPQTRLLLRGDATDLQQGETLLKGAISEVENLQNMLFSWMKAANLLVEENHGQARQLRRAETFGGISSNPVASTMKNGDTSERRGSSEGLLMGHIHQASSDPQLLEIDHFENLEQSADDETQVPHWNSTSNSFPVAEAYDRVILLSQRLYSLQAIIIQQDSQIELQRALLSDQERPSRHRSNVLLEQEKQRNFEKQKEELANFHKLQAQHQLEQQRWEKERERQKIQAETLEAQLLQREEECQKLEQRLEEEREELEKQRQTYQEDLERLRDAMKKVEKEKELLEQQNNLKRHRSIVHPSHVNYDDPTQFLQVSHSPSFRGDKGSTGGLLALSPKSQNRANISNADPKEVPPVVPPRKESISPQPAKAEVPIHLISTTNQAHKQGAVQQQIPTKLAALSKGKEKSFKSKRSHQRTQSAASIDMSQVVPIRVTGKEGGSLRAKRTASPQRIYQSDLFNPPASVKTSESFSTQKRSSRASPPLPPPFPKDVAETKKEKVIFL
ncbi:rho guanine nucleotide exchange factor 18a [Myripristis murdjan]|uniref:Rho/rac guanine nucleotide exchange factor (GEF) 18a n=1 Tax=Myripristis murdjan TaxID=586833 RepID=A0A667YCT4_9TELE|nr:rho guanine nucleotide exchange factor 18 [Myripristis murdjan]XP_029930953.1 rho guanine nucleotide exchange factor 18 [Myripristis murdjan]